MDKAEKNRALAEWLGWHALNNWPHEPSCTRYAYGDRCTCANPSEQWPDFYLSEEASALLLEKMAIKQVHLTAKTCWIDKVETLERWQVSYFLPMGTSGMECLELIADDPDRKAAIAEAALRLMESGKK